MNGYHFLKGRLHTRPAGNAALRLVNIIHRYGIDAEQFTQTLYHFIQLFKKYQIFPCLPVTASVLNRHSTLFKKIQDSGVELAIHGYKHIDYTQLNRSQILNHLEKAVDIFERHHILYSGFRFPFLRRSPELIRMLSYFSFIWDSSEAIHWNSIPFEQRNESQWGCYKKILESYQVQEEEVTPAIPERIQDLIEIPVSLPDDDMLVDRLKMQDKNLITKIWMKMLKRGLNRGELLVLAIHPERILWFKKSVQHLLEFALSHPGYWITSMSEIARWWKERNQFSFQVNKIARNRFRIKPLCTYRATVINPKDYNHHENHFNFNKLSMRGEVFELESQKRPLIGVGNYIPKELLRFLKNEGYGYEISDKQNNYNLYLNMNPPFTIKKRKQVQEALSSINDPLIRYWRWPDQKQACLTISGDIDAVDLFDFGERIYG